MESILLSIFSILAGCTFSQGLVITDQDLLGKIITFTCVTDEPFDTCHFDGPRQQDAIVWKWPEAPAPLSRVNPDELADRYTIKMDVGVCTMRIESLVITDLGEWDCKLSKETTPVLSTSSMAISTVPDSSTPDPEETKSSRITVINNINVDIHQHHEASSSTTTKVESSSVSRSSSNGFTSVKERSNTDIDIETNVDLAKPAEPTLGLEVILLIGMVGFIVLVSIGIGIAIANKHKLTQIIPCFNRQNP